MMFISAQVSLYPFRQPRLSPAIERAQAVFEERGLDVIPGPMSTMVSGELEAVFACLAEAFGKSAADTEIVMAVTVSNACPVPGGR